MKGTRVQGTIKDLFEGESSCGHRVGAFWQAHFGSYSSFLKRRWSDHSMTWRRPSGGIRSYIECVNVDYRSARDESYYDVQLDVKGCADLEASFEK